MAKPSVGSAHDSAIDLGPGSEAGRGSGGPESWWVLPSLHSVEKSGVADSVAGSATGYRPLERGEVVSKELGPDAEFRVGTPRLHVAISYDQVTKDLEERGSLWEARVGNGGYRYRVSVKWLPLEDEARSRPTAHVAALDDFPRGSEKTLSFHDSGWPKALWLHRGNDIVRIEYHLLKAEEQGTFASKAAV